MQKKGIIYRLSMLTGPAIFFGWAGYEMQYSYYNKDLRNEEIEAEKK